MPESQGVSQAKISLALYFEQTVVAVLKDLSRTVPLYIYCIFAKGRHGLIGMQSTEFTSQLLDDCSLEFVMNNLFSRPNSSLM